MSLVLCGALMSASGGASQTVSAQNPVSCGSPDWFEVQTLVLHDVALSPLCAAELQAAENHWTTAEKALGDVISSSPHSEQAYAAHSALTYLDLRNGRFSDSYTHLFAMSVIHSDADDVKNTLPLFKLLGSIPNMRVVQQHAASVATHEIDGNVFAPVSVLGASRSYMLDTGMNLSLMSESEARSLRLVPRSSTTSVTDISGLDRTAARIVNVDDIVIGGTELRHVPFLVVDDKNEAFVGIPAGQQGILGIQPLLALKTLTFEKNGTLLIGGGAKPEAIAVPMLFDGAFPVSRVSFRGHALTVTFDMGATRSTLNPPFAAQFHEVVETGKKESHKLNGISGSTNQRSITLNEVDLTFGKNVRLSPATVLLDRTTGTSVYAAANLGYDLMKQAKPFTIDFREMAIKFPPGR